MNPAHPWGGGFHGRVESPAALTNRSPRLGSVLSDRVKQALDGRSSGAPRTIQTCDLQADLIGLFFDDLRRSAMRNLIRAGVSQTVAMKISGHKTDATSRRYDITSTEDIADALKRTAELREEPTVEAQN